LKLNLLMCKTCTFDNAGFEMEFGEIKYKNFDLGICLTLGELGVKIGPSFTGHTCPLPTPASYNGFIMLAPSIPDYN
jgi:hypothetical protein